MTPEYYHGWQGGADDAGYMEAPSSSRSYDWRQIEPAVSAFRNGSHPFLSTCTHVWLSPLPLTFETTTPDHTRTMLAREGGGSVVCWQFFFLRTPVFF